MKKRSAMTVAGGLVAALLAGMVAMSLGFASGPSATAGREPVKPRVRTIERTVTIHKKAKQKPAQVVRVTAPAPTSVQSAPSAGTSFDESDDSFESEHEGDGEDHGDSGYDDGGSEHEDGGYGDD
jgi:hypothetical protein